MSHGSASMVTTSVPPIRSPRSSAARISQVRAITNKPILLSETGVGPGAGRFVKISNLFDGIRQTKDAGACLV